MVNTNTTTSAPQKAANRHRHEDQTEERTEPGRQFTVTLVGLHYEEVTAVYFGGSEGTVTKVEAGNEKNPGKITVTAPPGVGKVDITVVTSNGTSGIASKNDEYTYKKPTIASITPDEGPASGGTEVTITGSGFELGNHGTEFVFGESASTSVECTSSTSCVVIVPSAPIKKSKFVLGKQNVVAIVNGTGKSKKASFTYTE